MNGKTELQCGSYLHCIQNQKGHTLTFYSKTQFPWGNSYKLWLRISHFSRTCCSKRTGTCATLDLEPTGEPCVQHPVTERQHYVYSQATMVQTGINTGGLPLLSERWGFQTAGRNQQPGRCETRTGSLRCSGKKKKHGGSVGVFR